MNIAPCPFCGSNPVILKGEELCCCHNPQCFMKDTTVRIEQWNTRLVTTELSEEERVKLMSGVTPADLSPEKFRAFLEQDEHISDWSDAEIKCKALQQMKDAGNHQHDWEWDAVHQWYTCSCGEIKWSNV